MRDKYCNSKATRSCSSLKMSEFLLAEQSAL